MNRPPTHSAVLPATSPEEAESYVMRRMSMRHLRVLLALSEAGSLSAAADALHVTQPAVSKTLAEMEQGLGQTLFARRGRSLRATALAERLIQLARKLEAGLTRGGEDVASMVRGASGKLLIGSTNAALAQLLPDAIASMKREYPNVTLSVRTHAPGSLFAELHSGQLDVVIARVPAHDQPADLESLRLIEQQEVLVISNLHPLAKAGTRVGWDTLSQQAWIWPLPHTRSRALQDRRWQQMGLPLPRNVIETGDLILTLSLLKRIPCVAIMPMHAARVAALAGVATILPLQADLGLADLTLWHLPEPQSELVERFKQLLIEAAQAVLNQA